MKPRVPRILQNVHNILTRDLTWNDLNKSLNEDMRGMYEFYARSMKSVEGEQRGIKRSMKFIGHLFVAFLLKLTPPRRLMYAIAFVFMLFAISEGKTASAVYSFIIITFLLAMELADKLITKDELSVARDIQLSLQPGSDVTVPGYELYRGMNEIEGVLAEFKQRYRYVSDALGADQFQSAKRTLFDFHGGDCDDATIALGSLCRALGYPVKVRVVRTKDAEDWNHVYLMVNPDKRGEKYVALDGSVDAVMHKGKKTPIFVGWEAPDRIVADRRDMDV